MRVQLGGLLTVELSKLGLESAELFLDISSQGALCSLPSDIRKPIEAEGVLKWSLTPALTVQHIAAAIEVAWHTSLVSLSKENYYHFEMLCTSCSLDVADLSPHRNITELALAQKVMDVCSYVVQSGFARMYGNPNQEFKLFKLLTGERWQSQDIGEEKTVAQEHVEISKFGACAVLSCTNNLECMGGYKSSLGYCRYASELKYCCYTCLMLDVDDDYDF